MDTIHGLDNHPGLKHNIDMLGDKLTQYASNQCDYMDVAGCFRQTTEYIVNEFMKEFPECMGRDEIAQVDNLLDAGYLTDEQANALRDACRAGDVNAGRKSYRELKDIYDQLCDFLPSFLNWFFHPSTKALPEYTAGSEAKNRRTRRSNKRNRSPQQVRRRQRNIMYVVLIVLMIGLWGMMLFNSRQSSDTDTTVSIWTDRQGAQDEDAEHFAMGQAWTVEDEWEFAIDDVTAYNYVYERSSPYSLWGGQSTQQEYQVLLISYHYTNLGYEGAYDSGLEMSLNNAQIVDSYGYSAEQVSASDSGLQDPQAVPVGQTCEAQQLFLVLTDAQSATMTYTYPGTNETAIFDLSWDKPAESAAAESGRRPA